MHQEEMACQMLPMHQYHIIRGKTEIDRETIMGMVRMVLSHLIKVEASIIMATDHKGKACVPMAMVATAMVATVHQHHRDGLAGDDTDLKKIRKAGQESCLLHVCLSVGNTIVQICQV